MKSQKALVLIRNNIKNDSLFSNPLIIRADYFLSCLVWPVLALGCLVVMDLSPVVLIIALTLFYIVLGMFLDGISSVVLTMAIVEPMIRQAGIDVIWFGVFIVVVVEMAQVTPPIGFNLFVLQGMTKHEISYIARTAIPMVGLMIVMVVILVIWPELATWLPDNLRNQPG